MNKNIKVLWFIIILTVIAGIIDFPKDFKLKFSLFGKKIDTTVSAPSIDINLGAFSIKRDLTIKKGLDLQGGTELILQAKMDGIKAGDRDKALESAKEVVARRVDLYGVSEPLIQTSKLANNYRIIVELPGIKDINQAVELIGKTAQLDFREAPEGEATPSAVPIFAYKKTNLTGKDLTKAQVQFSSQTGEPVVALQFSKEGADKFARITQRNVGKPLAIFLDDIPVTAPIVNEAITSGDAVISGKFTATTAKNLAIELNAGALPVPITVVEQKNIGANLGNDSVVKSIKAGVIGLLIVIGFMLTYYGRLGLLADIALIIYGLLTLAIYKLIPVTLTLPGIAGFLLSVGMAVDSNILIFERMKEELREGRPLSQAMELGFGRAWNSIKDANICTIITALVLLNPLNFSWLVTWGLIKGFALTLLIGVLISLFTGIVVTRTLVRVFYKTKELKI